MQEAEAPSRTQLIIARVVIWLMIALSVSATIVYLFSDEGVNQRIWRDLIDRPGGKMSIRFILQPVLSAIAALHDGLKDARSGRSPYLWTILTNSAERRGRLTEGFIVTARTMLLGIIMDVIYQALVLKTFYPGESVIVAILLAFIPYVMLRGPIARLARHRHEKTYDAYNGVRK